MSIEINENKKAVKIKDANNTIIFIDKDADTQESIKKYKNDLKQHQYKNVIATSNK